MKEQKFRNDEDGVEAEILIQPATQAYVETEDTVTYSILGEARASKIIPIDECCARCDHIYYGSIDKCQEEQGKDAKARGFNKVVCPQQFG